MTLLVFWFHMQGSCPDKDFLLLPRKYRLDSSRFQAVQSRKALPLLNRNWHQSNYQLESADRCLLVESKIVYHKSVLSLVG